MNKSKQSGLDIDLGNRCSKIAFEWAKKTFDFRSAGSGNPLPGLDGAFSNVMDLGGVKIGMASDGVGTKIELAERTKIYHTIAFDLVAMVVDDLAANGLEPVNLSNILDVDALDAAVIDRLMEGLYQAAKVARVTVTGGEIAELGSRISGYGDGMHFNWAATGLAILPTGREVIDGSKVQVGDRIIALKSQGFRSNGFSLLRRIMNEQFGDAWHQAAYGEGKTWGQALLTPSRIYTPLIVDLIKADFEIHGIAHITGGGIGDNLQRVLKINGFGAVLDRLFEPPHFMRKVQELGQVSEAQAYRLWNMGNGMLLVVKAEQAEAVVQFAAKQQYQAQIAGTVQKESAIELKSRGMEPQTLIYHLKEKDS
ncbi:phosphoribosylformylglycinamidine cyclo-ligase [Caldithrix abyssi]|nr:phosphoribosylformylglycinamidine cyclo-ligase [Caldithrix abyssi]EHO40019.1 AIR synthase related protein domain protein [Caldithrix abyssi DSM 13497]